MLLYKYRPLSNTDFTLDIILNQHLHCSRYLELNDPFEGLFSATIKIPPNERFKYPFFRLPDSLKVSKSINDVPYESKDRIRICSLSASPSEILLWSHYAEGNKGISIEIDFSGLEEMVHEVKYSDELPQYGYSLLGMPTPEELLTHKTKHWKYENEYRLFSEDSFFDITGRIKRILLGSRISRFHVQLLKKICSSEISLIHTEIDTKLLKVKEKKDDK